jgi:hypothetical protein
MNTFQTSVLLLILRGCTGWLRFRWLFWSWLVLVSLPVAVILGPVIAVAAAWDAMAGAVTRVRGQLGGAEKAPANERR